MMPGTFSTRRRRQQQASQTGRLPRLDISQQQADGGLLAECLDALPLLSLRGGGAIQARGSHQRARRGRWTRSASAGRDGQYGQISVISTARQTSRVTLASRVHTPCAPQPGKEISLETHLF